MVIIFVFLLFHCWSEFLPVGERVRVIKVIIEGQVTAQLAKTGLNFHNLKVTRLKVGDPTVFRHRSFCLTLLMDWRAWQQASSFPLNWGCPLNARRKVVITYCWSADLFLIALVRGCGENYIIHRSTLSFCRVQTVVFSCTRHSCWISLLLCKIKIETFWTSCHTIYRCTIMKSERAQITRNYSLSWLNSLNVELLLLSNELLEWGR